MGGGGNVALAQTVSGVTARQRWPWNNLIDIDYTVSGVTNTEGLYIRFEVVAGAVTNKAAALDREPPVSNGTHRVTWNPEADGHRSLLLDGAVCEAVLKRDDPKRYRIIDLSGGKDAASYPVTDLPAIPPGGWTDEYKTAKLALRKIDPGTFMMGSPDNEPGRTAANEVRHEVTLTRPFYIGVFQVTQAQWERVMGKDLNRSTYKGPMRPVEQVSYNDIRGADKGAGWPASSDVDDDSFMGRIRAKAGLDGFDLPTEAQWEYACRAGTAGPWNVEGKDINDLGRYKDDQSDGKGGFSANHTAVGSYLPNAWGLYDMHGNTWEWCRDWFTAGLGTVAVADPVGTASGSARVLRGGSWRYASDYCRSAFRGNDVPASRFYDGRGFRPVCSAGPRP